MNIETAQRLLDYRKANGYSQEELAEKIGVSRQAISKWERSESSPDTDNLIALSNLYGVTIDELLNGADKPKRTAEKETVQSESDNSNEYDNEKSQTPLTDPEKDIEGNNEDWKHFYDKDKENIKKAEMPPRYPHLHALIPLAILIFYLIIGVIFPRGWAVGWILFLLIPIIETGIMAFRTKNPLHFAYPVLAIAIFLFQGMVFHVWHPTWIVFLTIPVYYLVCDAFRRGKKLKEDDYTEYQSSSTGTYYQPPGTDVAPQEYRTARHTQKSGSGVAKVVIAIIAAVTIIAVVAIISVFSWLQSKNADNIVSGIFSGIVDIVDSVVDEFEWNYDNDAAYTAGNGDVDPEGITRLSVNWLTGSITAEYYDGDTITFSEPDQKNSDHQLRWLVSGNELKIEYCKSGLKWMKNNDFSNKDLTIYLPSGFSLNDIDIETVSANINLNDLTAYAAELETVSGNITVSGEFTELDTESVSGNIIAEGTFINISTETVSGYGEITARTAPAKMELETVSGFINVAVPANISGFTLNYDTVSGNALVNDFEVKMPQNKTLVYGDGSAQINFESVSGNVEIRKAK